MRVLLFTDGSAGARAATTWLQRFGPPEPSALRIAGIAQSPPLGARTSSAHRALRRLVLDHSQRLCEEARAALEGRWREVSVEVIEGDPHERLLRAAEAWKPELVVLGRSGGPEPPPALGSLGRLGAYHLECSVLVVDRAPDSVREIVLGLDGSPSAREAVRLLSGFGFAAPPRVRALTVVGAWRRSPALENMPPVLASALDEIQDQEAADAQTLLARATAALGARAQIDGEVATGSPAEVLLEAAQRHRAELLAVGHQGLEAVRRLTLGSVAAQVLAAAPCSLLIGRK